MEFQIDFLFLPPPKGGNISLTTENTQNQEVEQVQPETTAPVTAKANSTAASHDDFDWDMDGAGFGTYTKSERASMEQQYAGTFNPIEEKKVVKGHVVAINDKDVVVNVGFKSDGLVPRQEFRDLPELKIGDEVEVFVDIAEDSNG